MSRTIADALRAEGREEGREEGHEEGREEGALTAARAILLGIVKAKFGRVPKGLRQQIEATTDMARLKASVYRAAKAGSWDDFQL